MPFRVDDRAVETCSAPGTGAFALAGAVIGFQRYNAIAGIAVNDTTFYFAESVNATTLVPDGGWECGIGTYTAANTLGRAPIRSSNSNALVNFTGTVVVSCGVPASRAAYFDDRNTLIVPAVAAAGFTVPPAGFMGLFAKPIGGRLMPAFVGQSGLDSVLMPHLLRNGISMWFPSGDGTGVTAVGANALTATGTATAANYATTSLHTRCTRLDYLVGTAAVTAVAGYRAAQNKWRGTEGYHHIFRVSPATGGTVGTRRFFAGIAGSTAAPTDVEPSSQTNVIGYGYDAADANWQVIRNDGTGTATKVNTGIARPSTDRPSVYAIHLFIPPGGAEARVQFIDESNGNEHSASYTTDIPAATQTIGPRAYHSVGGTSSVVGLTLFRGMMDTDN